jgi:hypothetical protein
VIKQVETDIKTKWNESQEFLFLSSSSDQGCCWSLGSETFQEADYSFFFIELCQHFWQVDWVLKIALKPKKSAVPARRDSVLLSSKCTAVFMSSG